MKRLSTVVVALLFVGALPAAAGVTFTSTTRAEGARGSEAQNSVIHAQLDGDQARLEFRSSGNPIMTAGTYLLTRDGGATFVLVNPKEKTYAKFDLAGMMGAVGGMMNAMGGMVKMKVGDPKVEKLLEEDGGKVAGLATRHYRFRTGYTMEMTIFGRANRSSTLTEEDVWATDEIPAQMGTAWRRWADHKLGFGELDKLVEAEKSKMVGMPLRRIASTTQTDAAGKSTQTKVTTEVTELDLHASIPASAFAIPSGYEETDLMAGAMNQAE